MIATVERTLRRRARCCADDRVAVAISGGADSVALAFALRELRSQGGPQIAGLIHLNHHLRGAESDADEAFCRDLARRFEWPIEVAHADVAAEARGRRQSIEVTARGARYAFFPRAATLLGATHVATAHTLDDQVETVLMRLLRGTSTRGAAGIPPRRGLYIRPLIDTRRADVRAYLAGKGEAWREDASNADVAILRNRLRHELVPAIERIAPGASDAIARFAALAADDEAALEAAAIELLPKIVLSEQGAALTDRPASAVSLDAELLGQAPAAVARRAIRHLMEALAPDVARRADDIEAVRAAAGADTPESAADLRGVRITRRGRVLGLAATRGRTTQRPAPFCCTLEIPGSVSIPEAGVVITARRDVVGDPSAPAPGAGARAVLAQAAVEPPLTVRTWRPGDRMRPLGAPGRRKLQDLFVDRKVPRSHRHRVPVIEDAAGRILWVPGVAVAEAGRVTTAEAGVVILEMRKDQ